MAAAALGVEPIKAIGIFCHITIDTATDTQIQRLTQPERQTETETETDRDRQTDRQTHRDTETQRDRDTHTHTPKPVTSKILLLTVLGWPCVVGRTLKSTDQPARVV